MRCFSTQHFHNQKFQPETPTLMSWAVIHLQFWDRFNFFKTSMILGIERKLDLSVRRRLTAKYKANHFKNFFFFFNKCNLIQLSKEMTSKLSAWFGEEGIFSTPYIPNKPTWKMSLAHFLHRLCWQGRMTTGFVNISKQMGQMSCFSKLSMVCCSLEKDL